LKPAINHESEDNDEEDKQMDVGFVVHSCELFARPTQLPGDVRGWLEIFAQHYLSAIDEEEKRSF